MKDLPPDNVLRQMGEPDRAERAEIARRQRDAFGAMTAEVQRKAIMKEAEPK